jgi:hypothetical protein
LFVKDPTFNPSPLIDWANGFPLLRLVVALVLASSLVVALRNTMSSDRATGFRLALLFTFTLLLSPASASYHLLFLALPAAMIWPEFRRDPNRGARWILAGSFLLIGLIPIAALEQFHFHGAWILLAFPRLILLTTIFIALVQLSGTHVLHPSPEVA